MTERKNDLIISEEQHQVLLGIMLGDGHLELAKNKKSARLKIEQSIEKRVYIEHLYQLFKSWSVSKIRLATHEKGINLTFSTLYSPDLLKYHQMFYKGTTRVIPQGIENEFTARSFAYLFMDDGGIKSKESKGVFINTYSLAQDEQESFCKFLDRIFNLKAKVVQDSKVYKSKRRFYPRIYISGKSFDTLVALLESYILPFFLYKIPPRRSEKSRFRSVDEITQLPKR